MVIRRIREHVAAHNWFAVLIDLVIVIIGVFIGIQVSNWNAARLERNQEQHYRERLIADLRSNEADMRQRRFYYGQVQRHATAALRALEQPHAPLGEQFLIDIYQATQVMPRTTKRHTYDEIISAGKGELLGGPEIRDRVSNYYLGIAAVRGDVRSYSAISRAAPQNNAVRGATDCAITVSRTAHDRCRRRDLEHPGEILLVEPRPGGG